MNCPQCNSHNTSKVLWNWWGGIIGALIVNKRKCNDCGCKFKSDNQHSKIEQNVDINLDFEIPDTCPHCKNPNIKKIRLCEWCGNQIC
jgi:hypothetical protein